MNSYTKGTKSEINYFLMRSAQLQQADAGSESIERKRAPETDDRDVSFLLENGYQVTKIGSGLYFLHGLIIRGTLIINLQILLASLFKRNDVSQVIHKTSY